MRTSRGGCQWQPDSHQENDAQQSVQRKNGNKISFSETHRRRSDITGARGGSRSSSDPRFAGNISAEAGQRQKNTYGTYRSGSKTGKTEKFFRCRIEGIARNGVHSEELYKGGRNPVPQTEKLVREVGDAESGKPG